MLRTKLIFFSLIAITAIHSQIPVPKNFDKPVLMHYMPWFETPEFEGFWGWHWKMNNQNPDIIDPITGQRQIASHFYPLIGPYSSKDPIVLEYHLLLMKYAGIDGILIDWYGVEGSNGDINSLLESANSIINLVGAVGLEFSLIIEDRFSESIEDGISNINYVSENYFENPYFFRYGAAEKPLMGVFGPITFETENEWTQIMDASDEEIEFLTLWYQKNDCGIHADGEYCWIYEDEENDDWYSRLVNFYTNRAPNLNTAMAIAYPGFEDFYLEGNAGNGFFTIPHYGGEVLDSSLNLVSQYLTDIDVVQLATWNDFGEGTMFEPTIEFGFDFLVQLQNYLGIDYSEQVFEQIHRLYLLRKEFLDSVEIQHQLDLVFNHLVNLETNEAVQRMDEIEIVSGVKEHIFKNLRLYPNPTQNEVFIEGLTLTQNEISILNQFGQETPFILKGNKMELPQIEKGIYWIFINSNSRTWTEKLVVL